VCAYFVCIKTAHKLWYLYIYWRFILNVTVFVVRLWGGQYREELILNVTVLVVRVWQRGI